MSKLIDSNLKDELMGSFLNGADFEQGLTLKLVSMVPTQANDPKYGVQKDGNGLKAGETWQYTFETENDIQKIFNNSSIRLSSAIARLDPEAGAKLFIKRSGSGTNTEWQVNLAK